MIPDTYSVFPDGMVLHLERLVDRVLMDLGNRSNYNKNNEIILTLPSSLTVNDAHDVNGRVCIFSPK